MVARGAGALVVVSSAAAWQPVPFMATYAATKAFELHLDRGARRGAAGHRRARAGRLPRSDAHRVHDVRPGRSGAHWAIPFDDVDLVVRATWRALAAGRRAGARPASSRAGSMLAARLLPRGLILRGARRSPTGPDAR